MKSYYPSSKLVKGFCKLEAETGNFWIGKLSIDFAPFESYSKGKKREKKGRIFVLVKRGCA